MLRHTSSTIREQCCVQFTMQHLTNLPDHPTWPTYLTTLLEQPTWPTYPTCLPDLPTWPTYPIFLPNLTTCMYPFNIPNLPTWPTTWPTNLTYQPDVPTWPTYLPELPTYLPTKDNFYNSDIKYDIFAILAAFFFNISLFLKFLSLLVVSRETGLGLGLDRLVG